MMVSSEQRSTLPKTSPVIVRVAAVRAVRDSCDGWIRATLFGAQPNMRVKLAAPALGGSGFRPDGRFARIPFVNTLVWRRSLRAVR
jgi:hypothetical protein